MAELKTVATFGWFTVAQGAAQAYLLADGALCNWWDSGAQYDGAEHALLADLVQAIADSSADTVTVSRADLMRVLADSKPVAELWAQPESRDAYSAALERLVQALQESES